MKQILLVDDKASIGKVLSMYLGKSMISYTVKTP